MAAENKEFANHLPHFSEFMAGFLKTIQAKIVVEVGSDVQLRVAGKLAPHCERYYSVNFPEDNLRMGGWYDFGKELGVLLNAELVGGSALQLSKLIPHADVILLHNVCLEFENGDMALICKHRRGETKLTDDQLEELTLKFAKAREKGYREFLEVARPGFIVTFLRSEFADELRNFFIEQLGVDSSKLKQLQLLYDNGVSDEKWQALIIENN